jgi:hypothetical protein
MRSAANPAGTPNDGWWADVIRSDGGLAMSTDSNRHWVAVAANFYCGTEYLLGHCRLNPITRTLIEDYHQAYLMAARRQIDSFRPMTETSESGDGSCMKIAWMVATGNLAYIRNGTLGRTVDLYLSLTNNLGAFVGEGTYIGTDSLSAYTPGRHIIAAAAFHYRDPEYQWLWKHFKGTEYCQTGATNDVCQDSGPEKFPQRYLGVYVTPFDPNFYRWLAAPSQSPWQRADRPLTAPYETLYNTAFFRDGYTPETAFLSIIGTRLEGIMMTNTIPQYTDLGQILLFNHAQLGDRFCRNAAIASNGRPCMPPNACIMKASVRGDQVSALSSVDPFNGNTQQTRTIVHRTGHYFVVLDSFQALADDDYTFNCRWRSVHPARLEGGVWKESAPQGVALQIQSAEPVRQESVHEDYDGVFRPFMLTQSKQAHLKVGETVSFRNLFFAANDSRPDQCEARGAGENALLVRGSGKDWSETALIGVGASPEAWPEVQIEADIYYVSGETLVAANATRAIIGGKSLIEGAGPANLTISVKEHSLAPALAKYFDSLPPVAVQPPTEAKEYGFAPQWQFHALEFPPVRHVVASIVASRGPMTMPVQVLTDPYSRIGLLVPHQAAMWKTADGPLQLTLDLGAVKSISAIRLIGTLETGFLRRFSWNEGDLSATVAFSDDNFVKDSREGKAAQAEFREYIYPHAHKSSSGRMPELAIKADARARYIRLNLTSRKELISLQKIWVEGQERQDHMLCELKAADLDNDGNDELVVKTAGSEIAAVGADGKKRWSKTLPAAITAWNAVDLENDRRAEILADTAEDACYALEGADGKQRWRVDFFEFSKQGPAEQYDRDHNPYNLSSVTAWRPEASGKKEVFGTAKLRGLTIRPDLAIDNGTKGIHETGYAMLAAPDRSVLGREVMVLLGGALAVKETDGRNLLSRNMKALLPNNGDMPVFLFAGGVTDARQKGFIGVNHGSILWAPADPAQKGWDEFSDIPITAALLKDLDGDGSTELLLGF